MLANTNQQIKCRKWPETRHTRLDYIRYFVFGEVKKIRLLLTNCAPDIASHHLCN